MDLSNATIEAPQPFAAAKHHLMVTRLQTSSLKLKNFKVVFMIWMTRNQTCH